MIRASYISVFALLLTGISASADPTLILTPSGTVSGNPGDTVGWGYSIDNDTVYSLIVTESDFCEPGQDPLFTTCSPTLGTYTDFIASNGTLISPGTTGSQAFDPSGTGVGEYVIDPSATPGQSDIGSIVVEYQLFDDNFDQIGGTMELSASAEVDVTGTGTSPVPEPATQGLVVAGLLLSAVAYRRFRFNRSQGASRSSI
jgi:hypothetical protein